MMNKLTEKLGERLPVVPEDPPRRIALFNYLRNRLSKVIAGFRTAPILQPMHRRYGPIKYNHVLPAFRGIRRFLKPGLRGEPSDKALYQLWAKRSEQFRYNRERAV